MIHVPRAHPLSKLMSAADMLSKDLTEEEEQAASVYSVLFAVAESCVGMAKSVKISPAERIPCQKAWTKS